MQILNRPFTMRKKAFRSALYTLAVRKLSHTTVQGQNVISRSKSAGIGAQAKGAGAKRLSITAHRMMQWTLHVDSPRKKLRFQYCVEYTCSRNINGCCQLASFRCAKPKRSSVMMAWSGAVLCCSSSRQTTCPSGPEHGCKALYLLFSKISRLCNLLSRHFVFDLHGPH